MYGASKIHTNPQMKVGAHMCLGTVHVQTHTDAQVYGVHSFYATLSRKKASQTQGIHNHQMWEHAEIHSRKKRKGRKEEDGGGQEWVQLSNCSLPFRLFTPPSKNKIKNSRVPLSVGTAARQILVLSDVRNVAFWRATVSTQLWRLSQAACLQAQKHDAVSRRLSIQRAGKRKSCMRRPWIPLDSSSYSRWSPSLSGAERGNFSAFSFFFSCLCVKKKKQTLF